jgi:hypothetical protein
MSGKYCLLNTRTTIMNKSYKKNTNFFQLIHLLEKDRKYNEKKLNDDLFNNSL